MLRNTILTTWQFAGVSVPHSCARSSPQRHRVAIILDADDAIAETSSGTRQSRSSPTMSGGCIGLNRASNIEATGASVCESARYIGHLAYSHPSFPGQIDSLLLCRRILKKTF